MVWAKTQPQKTKEVYYVELTSPTTRHKPFNGLEACFKVMVLIMLSASIACGLYILLDSGQEVEQTCPCSEARFCERIKDTTRKEVFVFSLNPKQDDWRFYDWDKVTTVVMVGYLDVRVVCKAHEFGARAITIGDVSTSVLPNKSARSTWIQQQLAKVDQYYLDGINFDYESAIQPEQFDLRNGYTDLIRETKAAFREKYPNSMISVDVAWSPDHIDSRYYDYVGMATAADLLFVMAYDEQSQIFGDCIAGANSGLPRAMSGVQGYLNLQIPADKLVFGIPWYGYDYQCLSLDKDGKCWIPSVPFRGVNCSDAAGKQINYSYIVHLVKNSTTGRKFDDVSQSPYFNYENPKDGANHQVWYDDPQSLGVKFMYVIDQNLRGVGVWNTEAVNYTSQDSLDILAAREMWSVFPDYKTGSDLALKFERN